MALLDLARDDDRHTSERLTAAPVIWLGTVPDGRRHNVPVWFARVRNARTSPAVRLAAKFREKYAQSLGDTSFEEWRATFSQPVLVHVQRTTAWTPAAAGIACRVVP